jgi:hypothetical protein
MKLYALVERSLLVFGFLDIVCMTAGSAIANQGLCDTRIVPCRTAQKVDMLDCDL